MDQAYVHQVKLIKNINCLAPPLFFGPEDRKSNHKVQPKTEYLRSSRE